MTIPEYLAEVNKEYKTGRATEHSYRGYLQTLIKTIANDVMVTNEPTRVKCGAPDYIITKRDIPVGYIEAKDIGYKLDDKQYKEQFDRYRKSLPNLIITDYIDFWLYIDGELIKKIRIAEITTSGIKPTTDHHNEFINLIKDFCTHVGQTIKSSKKLAEMMAGKARMLSEVIEKALIEDEAATDNPDTALQAQLHAFKEILIHDIGPKEFADIYAQTIAYGMFAARLHDPTLPTFSRQEAAELIPKTNPFLRKLFQYIAGYDLDRRLVWIVDGLAEIFRATDIAELLKNFGKSTQTNDPIIHFYETFLSEYDPALRKARGVWYTPEPVVNFIVRAVNDILKTEFNLKDGLADTSKTKIKTKVYTKATSDQRSKIKEEYIEQEVHKVQILDPATGTGTFLSEVVKQVYKKYEGQQGIWTKYVDEHLIPRLNGFELLMASYAMAHLKLDMLLTETGYKLGSDAGGIRTDQRFKIYLTNSLEEHHQDTGTIFANWLSTEANEANYIKRDTPVMVVIGNPPYNISSFNKGTWVESLVEVYKTGLNEQNLNSLSDDYVKFLRFAQFLIDKNQNGVVAMITNNSFIDGITQRLMRRSLFESFDKIYVYDLHGSLKRREKTPEGLKDENVFDIQQGVSINIFIKKKQTDEPKQVLHFDLLGSRKLKYKTLFESNLSEIKWTNVYPTAPSWYFVPKDTTGTEKYNCGFTITDLFSVNGNGIKFRKDNLLVKSMYSVDDVKQMLNDINNLGDAEIYSKYSFKETPDWNLTEKKKLFKKDDLDNIIGVEYRQFDTRHTYYPLSVINQIIVRGDSRKNLMQHYIVGSNLGLVIGRQGQVVGGMPWNLVFISTQPTDMNIFYRGGGINFPLYLYSDLKSQDIFEEKPLRTANLNSIIVNKISDILGLNFTVEKNYDKDTYAPIDILDYIYAILHSPKYREEYKEFLKTDFPKIPYPKSTNLFWQLVKLGSELRKIHLLESDIVTQYITQYPANGDNIVAKIKYTNNRVYINDNQYFDKVPRLVWEFYIGGYQPAQKWLKDRKDRELNLDEVMHYQKIVVALNETIRLMVEIDKIEFE